MYLKTLSYYYFERGFVLAAMAKNMRSIVYRIYNYVPSRRSNVTDEIITLCFEWGHHG